MGGGGHVFQKMGRNVLSIPVEEQIEIKRA